MIQLTHKQGSQFCMTIHGVSCTYQPCDLWSDGLTPLRKVAKGTTVGWYVARRFVSAFQIHRAIRATSNAAPAEKEKEK